jgi:DNA adenine methylase
LSNLLRVKTVAYKGSKRKLISQIAALAEEISAKSVFDGFSGTGIVSANLRHLGLKVCANDLNISSYLYGKVFLEGYNRETVDHHLRQMNNLSPVGGWVTKNYAGTTVRKVRGLEDTQERPLGLLHKNASMVDAARDYVEELNHITQEDKNALIFSVILGCDSVFNNSNDQKSSLKEWSSKSKKDVVFCAPTLVEGPPGIQHKGDVFSLKGIDVDMIYFDPPYTGGVLYKSCYHLNDSLTFWDKPALDYSYAIPRPARACFKGKKPSPFYSKKTISDDFHLLLETHRAPRVVLSYSDAPRNIISIEELVKVGKNYGNVTVKNKEHKICTQPKTQEKRSTKLKEYFIIIDN